MTAAMVSWPPIGAGQSSTSTPNDDPESVDFEALESYAKIGGGNSYYDLLKSVLPPYMSDLAPLLNSGNAMWARHTQWPNPSMIDVVLRGGTQGLFTGQRTIDDLKPIGELLGGNGSDA